MTLHISVIKFACNAKWFSIVILFLFLFLISNAEFGQTLKSSTANLLRLVPWKRVTKI